MQVDMDTVVVPGARKLNILSASCSFDVRIFHIILPEHEYTCWASTETSIELTFSVQIQGKVEHLLLFLRSIIFSTCPTDMNASAESHINPCSKHGFSPVK